DAQPAAPFVRGFVSGDGVGDAGIVDGALLAQPGDGVLDRVLVVPLAGEPLTYLLFGQLAPREHLETVDVSAHQPPKRVISGAFAAGVPVTVCAIWSRLMSAVVAMPWTRSLNSSTLLAQRSASSSVTSACS